MTGCGEVTQADGFGEGSLHGQTRTVLVGAALYRERGAKRPRHIQALPRPIKPRTVSCRSAGSTTTLALLLPARFSMAPT